MSEAWVCLTGASGCIGGGIRESLSERGYRVIGLDKKEDPSLDWFVEVDLSRPESVENAMKEVQSLSGGSLDALINNGGIADPTNKAPDALDLAYWEEVISTNLTGYMTCTKFALPMLRETTRAAIVNIASTRAHMSEPNCEAYAATKGGIVALSHALAISLGPHVRVNCVSPGWIAPSSETLSEEDHAQHPVGRVGRPDDVGKLVAYLLSEGSAFITGQDFLIDGGMSRKMMYA